ncbi:unnamed protein product [Rodentolepis nana]|uniref:C3H1-type domain-containing protein n=1 Tax=Rodentolepis nana TaxID=102285 RepID=A0A0R3TJM1_RODNA|nr:unnamed protein product [Rodentolepis nana]
MGMGRRSRSPNATSSEAPAEKIAKRTDSSDTTSDVSTSKQPVVKCESPSSASKETLSPLTPFSRTVLVKDAHHVQSRVKRQDWCRWPICKDFYRTGNCPFQSGNEKDENLCQLAHVREEDGISEIADGYVRICFDSMGLIQPACRRSRCSYFHPPKHIRDQIIARRHAQYLEEKQAKILRNQSMQSALMQLPQTATTAMNPFIYVADPLNAPYNQFMMYNGCLMSDMSPANLMTANRVDPTATKVGPQAVGIDASQIAYQQLLPAPAMLPPINWAEYLAKVNTHCIQPQRPDAISQYNWLPLAQLNPSLLGTFIQQPATFAFQTLGPISPVATTIGLPANSSVLSCVPSAAPVPASATQ